MSQSQEYEVESILEEGFIQGEKHYLVKWKGYPHSENTWEPIANLQNCIDLVQQWHAKIETIEKNRKIDKNKLNEYKIVDSQQKSQVDKSICEQSSKSGSIFEKQDVKAIVRECKKQRRSELTELFRRRLRAREIVVAKYSSLNSEQTEGSAQMSKKNKLQALDSSEQSSEEEYLDNSAFRSSCSRYKKKDLELDSSETKPPETFTMDPAKQVTLDLSGSQQLCLIPSIAPISAAFVEKNSKAIDVGQSKSVNQISSVDVNKSVAAQDTMVQADEIVKVLRRFYWEGMCCFEVESSNSKTVYVSHQNLKDQCPRLLCDFYESEQDLLGDSH